MHYSDYLQLDKILNAQQPESERQGQPARNYLSPRLAFHILTDGAAKPGSEGNNSANNE